MCLHVCKTVGTVGRQSERTRLPYLARSLDALEEAEEDDDPAQQQAERHLPLDGAQSAQTAGHVQHRATATQCVTACCTGTC